MFDGIATLSDESLGLVNFEWTETVQLDRKMLEPEGVESFVEYVDGLRTLRPSFPPAPEGWRWELRNNVVNMVLRFTYAPTLPMELRWRLVPIPDYVAPLPTPVRDEAVTS